MTFPIKGTSTRRFGSDFFFGMDFYCCRYSFSVALISALALLKYANLRLTVVV